MHGQKNIKICVSCIANPGGKMQKEIKLSSDVQYLTLQGMQCLYTDLACMELETHTGNRQLLDETVSYFRFAHQLKFILARQWVSILQNCYHRPQLCQKVSIVAVNAASILRCFLLRDITLWGKHLANPFLTALLLHCLCCSALSRMAVMCGETLICFFFFFFPPPTSLILQNCL